MFYRITFHWIVQCFIGWLLIVDKSSDLAQLGVCSVALVHSIFTTISFKLSNFEECFIRWLFIVLLINFDKLQILRSCQSAPVLRRTCASHFFLQSVSKSILPCQCHFPNFDKHWETRSSLLRRTCSFKFQDQPCLVKQHPVNVPILSTKNST